MYKVASDLSQRRARQLWLADLQGPTFDSLPPAEQRANLILAKNDIEAKRMPLPDGPERVELGRRINELNLLINAIRPKLKGPKSTPEHFIDVARERMTPFLFKVFLSEASERAAKAEGRA